MLIVLSHEALVTATRSASHGSVVQLEIGYCHWDQLDGPSELPPRSRAHRAG